MLRKREIVFSQSENKRLNINNGSLFHGFLMENLSSQMADYLHTQGLRPFSQYLRFSREENRWIWTIGTLDEGIDREMERILSENSMINLKNKDMLLEIDHIRSYPTLSYKDLTRKVYSESGSRDVTITFHTPCSFKISGNNVNLPEIGFIYNNLLNKWNSFAKEVSIDDKDAIDHIIQNTYVSDFNIKGNSYSLESTRKKGFTGKIKLKLKGPDPLVSLCNLVFSFAEYSGIGSSTALGMGGISVEFK